MKQLVCCPNIPKSTKPAVNLTAQIASLCQSHKMIVCETKRLKIMQPVIMTIYMLKESLRTTMSCKSVFFGTLIGSVVYALTGQCARRSCHRFKALIPARFLQTTRHMNKPLRLPPTNAVHTTSQNPCGQRDHITKLLKLKLAHKNYLSTR